MFPDEINELGVSAIEVRDHLTQLQAERALARGSELAEVRAYMADLDEEIEATRQLYVISAVLEIASLRAELSGVQVG
jgi:hypothetical protein